MSTVAGDQAKVSVSVAVDPGDAFRIFTEEIDQWWLRGPKYRVSGGRAGTLILESRLGGSLFERCVFDDGTRDVHHGTVAEWDPPARLVFEWRGVNFAPGEVTEVEVTFSVSPRGTNVTVIHRGWSKLRSDHPVRHGQQTAAFIRTMGLWWGDLMTSMRERADER